MKIRYYPYRYIANTSTGVTYSGRFSYRFEENEGFITGERRDGLERLMSRKMVAVDTGKTYAYKILPEIGLNEMILKEIKFGKTKSGFQKCTLTWTKSPIDSWFRQGKESYVPIECTHLLFGKNPSNFENIWFTPFSNEGTKEQFEGLIRNTRYKCIVLHREEQFTRNGIPLRYTSGRVMGQLMIRIKPEIVAVYAIDTPDEEIKFSYFKLYVPVK